MNIPLLLINSIKNINRISSQGNLLIPILTQFQSEKMRFAPVPGDAFRYRADITFNNKPVTLELVKNNLYHPHAFSAILGKEKIGLGGLSRHWTLSESVPSLGLKQDPKV
jgi:hypothetical protein